MKSSPLVPAYTHLLSDLSGLLEQSRRASARTVNALMTATYWEVGRRIVEFEQGGEKRAEYGEALLVELARDLTARFGRGFGKSNLFLMRKFYLASAQIFQTASGKLEAGSGDSSIFQTLSGISAGEKRATPLNVSSPSSEKSSTPPFALAELARAFPLPWSHYVLLISRARSPEAFAFYHAEALRGGWSVRQLDRQMASLFYERAALSKNKAAALKKGEKPQPNDAVFCQAWRWRSASAAAFLASSCIFLLSRSRLRGVIEKYRLASAGLTRLR